MSSSLVYPPAASSGVLNNFAATVPPNAGNDASQGFAPGSLWMIPNPGGSWRCRDATIGAAVWVRMDTSDFFGYLSGNIYEPIGPLAVAGAAMVANTLRLHPFLIKERTGLASIGVRLSGVVSGGNISAAIYAFDINLKRPTGQPLYSVFGLSTTSAGVLLGALTSAYLEEGAYWAGFCSDSSPTSIGAGGTWANQFIGSATAANPTTASTLNFSVPQTYGTFPDLTGVTLTETPASAPPVPLLMFKAA